MTVSREHESCEAPILYSLEVRLGLDQCPGDLLVTVLAAEHQGGPTVGLCVVNVGTLLDQCPGDLLEMV